ncbi:MAG: translocation/assembly module TamB domain-containing protein [Pseudomonadota bacterium]
MAPQATPRGLLWQSAALALVLAVPAAAQQDDRSYLTAFLEDNLSDAGRQVVVTGFTGALSSRANVEQLTIADADGVWLTLKGVTLDWSRAALLGGRIEVDELSAQEIIIDRMPVADDEALPAPEAGGFSLPDLPVSVNIGSVIAEKITLGAPVLGAPIEGRLEASLTLAGGEGRGALVLDRTDDGPDGTINLEASYSNASQQLVLDLTATEAEGGIAATLLDLPGTPAAALSIQGAGPVGDFAADVRLATDAVDRLAGKVQLTAQPDGGTAFSADLRGDLAPLFLPRYAEFFGSDIAIVTKGARSGTGRMVLDQVALTTRALALNGSLALASDGLPESFALNATLGLPDGSPVLLPLTGPETRVAGAEITLAYDATQGEGWTGSALLTGLDRADLRADRFGLDGSGRISRAATGDVVGATLTFQADGLLPTDVALAQALGGNLRGAATLYWQEGQGALSIPRLTIDGDGYDLDGRVRVEGLEAALRMTGRMQANATDLSRFAGLAGQPIGGAGTVILEGTGSPLAGDFDVTGTAQGQDLRIGQPQVDAVLRGTARLQASARRDETGTTLRDARIQAQSLTATAQGTLATSGSALTAELEFADLSVIGGGIRGALSAKGAFTGTPTDGVITLDGTARGLATGQADTDRLLAGSSVVSARLAVRDGQVQIESARLANPQLTADATGRVAGALREIELTGRLANLGLLIPEFPGPVTVRGTAVQDAAGYRLDLRGTGPGQIDARVAGTLATNMGSANLTLAGTAQAGLANAFIGPRAISGPLRFDLALNGRVALSSLSGRVSLSGGRITDPDLALAFERTEVVADLAGGSARLSGTTALSTGGRIRVDGSVGLTAPYGADLAVQLENLTLRDPELYETTATGSVTLRGPLTGGALIAGRVALDATELRIPSTGFGGLGGLPGLQHVNEPAAVRATRARAGLLGDGAPGGSAGGNRPLALDLTISAPQRVFIRGRGLDAELGGEVRLTGTTAAIVPSGGFDLIRGRLDILGKRLDLTEASLQLQGDFVPYITVAAASTSDDVTSYVRIEGPASDPEVTFTSSPELPQEEVLARLLFGRGLETISALQAAQLANAVATLAGRGGEGLIGKLRKGFGLDDLDVSTGEDGNAAVRAGKYLSENVYSEVQLGQDGKTQINLNLDIKPGLTVKGRVSADGSTGIGIFLEKDY